MTASVELTLAGAAVGGAAWALSLAWSDRIGVAEVLPPEPCSGKQPNEEGALLLFLPLLVVPFP